MKAIGPLVMTGLLLASCRQQPQPPNSREQTIRHSGCADRLEYGLNRTSFDSNGANQVYPEERLAGFKARAAKAFRSAADELCRRGELKPKALSGIRRVVIETASGAMEPVVFQDEQFGRDSLVFQWVFAEADLEIPDRKAIEDGLRCWNDPGRGECAGDND